MNIRTIERLNALNRAFYVATAESFDQTRGKPWPGWQAILPHVPARARVLDVGCGNGRFGAFLMAQSVSALAYTGVDSNPTLLDRARVALAPLRPTLIERDILSDALPPEPFDLVALFGVLHHVPGYATRRMLMQRLAERVAPGGLLCFSAWRFYDFARFRDRTAPWPADLAAEPNDYLLEWRRGVTALRYCHHVDTGEHAELVRATGLHELTTYYADGESGESNRYSLLQRDAS